jgi:hypothetical protein
MAAMGAGPGGRSPLLDRSRDRRFLAVAVSALVIGILGGAAIAFQVGQGGLGGALGGAMILLGLVGGSVVAGVLWLVVTVRRRASVERALVSLTLAAGLVAAGAYGGYAISAGPAGIPPTPVVLEAAGRMTGTVTGDGLQLVARAEATARCFSVDDDRDLAYLTTDDLGEFGPFTLRAWVHTTVGGADPVRVDLVVDTADLAEGADPLGWTGPARLVESDEGRTRGEVAFENLPREVVKQPSATSSAADWPATLSGTISWACAPW